MNLFSLKACATSRAHILSLLLTSLRLVGCAVTPSDDTQDAVSAQQIELEGTLQVLVEDHEDQPKTRHFLETASGGVELRIANPAAHPRSGAKVKVKARNADNEFDVIEPDVNIAYLDQSGTASTSTSTSSLEVLPNTLGEQKTLVMLLNFQDKPSERPFTQDDVNRAVFETASNYFRENSYGQTWLSGNTLGWTTIGINSTVCDQTGIASKAKAAALAAGFDPASYTRLVYVFPRNTNCTWDGASTVGGSPSQAWINGKLDLAVVGHELGHSFGLEHSLSLSCAAQSIGDNCNVLEYGDGIDLMGWSPQAHLNSYQKEKLGWLGANSAAKIQTVETSGTYQIGSLETLGSAPKSLKILRSVDASSGWKTWYYVELRQAVGFDSILSSSSSMMNASNILNGVVIHSAPDASRNTSQLLDMTPETYDLYTRDPALTAGRSFTDPQAQVTISAESVSSGTATVKVTVPATEPTTPATSINVTVSTAQSVYARGQLVPISAVVRTNGSAVSGASVNFTISKPNGSVVQQTASTDAQGIAAYGLRLKRSDPRGSYLVNANAVNGSLSASASTSFTVQ